MNEKEFCLWLQGFFELGDLNAGIAPHSTRIIQRRLNTIFSPGVEVKPADIVIEEPNVCPIRPVKKPGQEGSWKSGTTVEGVSTGLIERRV